MEALLSPGSVKQTPTRKSSLSSVPKDLWLICKEGSIADLDSALQLLKKTGGNIDARNVFGLTPLHIAIWRNHVPIVKRLLAAGADPDARDGESGWSSLHRALHFGHLAIASVLLQAGASLTLEDSKCRTPVDLLSGPVSQVVGPELKSVATEVYSWGSGTNYQLGTGNAHIQKLPCKVDAFHGLHITKIAASKFHSAAVGSDGKLYTWGFGRGGRLGHADFDVHSGQAAVITPRQVTIGLGSRRVKVVAAAKHHTVVATDSGEVFTWGSNREGQLGYTSVDTQATPRRVSSLRAKIVSVAAANKHSVAVAESGEVYTWGCNKEGQLGYGTSNSASNSIPRMVEYLKGKDFRGVSAAKYHTVVLGADGEVFTWGHRLVTPRRVAIARNIKKNGFAPLKFHRMERLHVISVAAGLTHTTALTDDGALFYWASADPELRCQQLYSMCERTIVSVSAGKYWTSFVTNTGDVYMWDGKKNQVDPPNVTRLRGLKRASSVCVGETHLLVLSALYHPTYLPHPVDSTVKPVLEDDDKIEEFNDGIQFNENEAVVSSRIVENEDINKRTVPSLKGLCEKVAAEFLVEPRNVVQLLEIADSLGADDLRNYCEEIAVRNLDYIFTVAAPAIAGVSPEVLVKLEKSLDTRSSEDWSYRHLPTPTATFPAVVYSDEEDNGQGCLRLRENNEIMHKIHEGSGVDSFLQSDTDHDLSKLVRALRKKLQQIEMLEAKQLNGHELDDQQFAKLQTKSSVEIALAELGFPVDKESKPTSSSSDVKGYKKSGASRKQRKAKQKTPQAETSSAISEITEEPMSIKGFPDIKLLGTSNNKEIVSFDVDDESNNAKFPCLESPKVCSVSRATKTKKKNRKGGLSMFLSGALDDASKHAPPPPPVTVTPTSTGPAWGGAKFTQGHTSLRDIQIEQNKTKEVAPIKSISNSEDSSGIANSGHVLLSSFLPSAMSNPIPLIPAQSSEGDKNTPPWSSGTSPGLGRLSLRDIQKQQERKQPSISQSPKTRTSGFSVSPSDAGGMKDSVPNRWFKPEIDAPSPIRFIQIEERAIKDLKRFYSSVKIVKPQQQSS